MKRVAIYCRVSTTDQSTGMQREELEAYAKARGYENYQIFEDVGVSGTKSSRPELNKLMGMVRARKVDLVLVWKLDRLFRSLINLVQTLQEFHELGIEFISLKDNIDLTTSSGRLMVHMLGAFSQFERDLIVERVKSGLRSAKARGKRLGRPACKVTSDQVRALKSAGLTYRQIASKLKISPAKVCLLLK